MTPSNPTTRFAAVQVMSDSERTISGYKAQCELLAEQLEVLIAGCEARKQSLICEGNAKQTECLPSECLIDPHNQACSNLPKDSVLLGVPPAGVHILVLYQSVIAAVLDSTRHTMCLFCVYCSNMRPCCSLRRSSKHLCCEEADGASSRCNTLPGAHSQ